MGSFILVLIPLVASAAVIYRPRVTLRRDRSFRGFLERFKRVRAIGNETMLRGIVEYSKTDGE